ncbi:tRNA (guanine(37)-N1)-methyltransferase [Thamnophis elegans]|uniref:tRNA (guanine(37)-N1)-methyltransferase n=1 Tax=Thamnophis elegans TaxID=35005 RepID=UPI001376C002|nr:tRNA (guanine(37)-N1)-methyltransferase [Thamnophis elegans]XP_032091635.1 tRNA (guanine(37)-N1)-methyltransferase [Thamnophis elegans]XP_032091643.1 tRNA (guanine(37)-N1)-methyltransferase [Thamnophis elegans]XP_032091651.1 tRNA (guanine(37)-N1)-methyltransferase [Thamnophis elegans]
MRFLRQFKSLFPCFPKVKYFGSETLFPTLWMLWNWSFNRLPEHLPKIQSQRQRFFTLQDMADKKPDLDGFLPHPRVRGMTTLDKTAFKNDIIIPALLVNKDVTSNLLKSLKGVLLKRPGLKRVVEDPDDENRKYILLDPHKISADGSLGESEQQILKSLGINPEVVKYKMELTYDNFKTEEILKAVLPEGQEITTAFSRIGHIAHMNLRSHQLPYKHLIGHVIVDKNQGITCAVNKINIIDSTYRNFEMELLAGDGANMITKVKENYISYEFDFSKVYWNPRLSTEHLRIVNLLKPGDLIFDVFAGVGPFAIPAAKKNCKVFANDLNPESCKWLQHNCKLNKVDKKVQVFNLDGRNFLKGPVKEELDKHLSSKEWKNSVHIIMNLPAMAIEFLDVFRNLLKGEPVCDELPTVHCHCFSKHDNPTQDAQERVEALLGTSLHGLCSVKWVRNVAPNKEMMCISFQLPAEVLYKPLSSPTDDPEEPPSKRPCPNENYTEENNQTI